MSEGAHRSQRTIRERVRLLRGIIRENGAVWGSLYLVLRVLKTATDLFEGWQRRLEAKRDLSGYNALAFNRMLWDQYDWEGEGLGEEWSISEEWKHSVIDHIMRRHIREGATVLEIGPGAGRWAEHLADLAEHLILVDLSERCIQTCRWRLAGRKNISFHVNDGARLDFLPDDSVDAIWSFDVFVHIGPREIESYVGEFRRVLRPGGRGIIHHAKDEGMKGGYRSRMSAERFTAMVERTGMRVVSQFDAWGPDDRFDVRGHGDAITVFERP